jgi:ribosomal protein L3
MFRTMMKGQRWEQPSVVGEVALDAFEGKQWIDVSAIGKGDDNTGIMHLYSTETNKTVHAEWSGCYEFPCGNAYLKPNDEGTRVTTSGNLTCEVGGHPSTLSKNAKDQARLPKITEAIKKQKTPGTKPFWGTWAREA